MSTAGNPVDEPEPQVNGQQVRKRTQQRSRPGKSLPTDRMKFEAQQRVLITYGKLSGPEKKVVTAERLSQAMGKELSHFTVGLSNGFFVEAGWLEKRGRGEFAASDALIEYTRRRSTNRDDVTRAVQPLREAARGSWFWQCIKSQLDFSSSDEDELLFVLMSEAEAGDSHLPQLRNLLEWVEYIGLIRRADGLVHLASSTASPGVDPDVTLGAEAPATQEEPPATNGDVVLEPPAQEPVPGPQRVESPALMSFDFSCRVTAEDLAKLNSEQIQAVFAAVGTLMALNAK